jgi:CRISPR-associated exonuclease Cas4
MFAEDELISISALSQFLYCPRRCALIHIEQIWSENVFTTEGSILHEKAHSGVSESRDALKIVRSLRLASLTLGITGVADVVEFHQQADGAWRPFPVEYKRGSAKNAHCYAAQLCAQTLCLEEMLSVSIPAGALFLGKTRRRKSVAFSQELREQTLAAIRDVRTLLAQTAIPPAVNDERCEHCSLKEQCLPGATAVRGRAARYVEALRVEE